MIYLLAAGLLLAVGINVYLFRSHFWPTPTFARPTGVEWGAWADGRNLEMAEGTGYIAAVGVVREVFVRVEARWDHGPDLSKFHRGSTQNTPTYLVTTRITVKSRVQLPLGIQVLSANRLDHIADRMLSGADIVLEDPKLNERFTIRGEQPSEIIDLFRHPSIRDALEACGKPDAAFQLTNHEISYSTLEYISNTNTLDQWLDCLVDLATALRAICPAEGRSISEMTPIPISQVRTLNSIMKRLTSLGPVEAERAVPSLRSMLCSFNLKVIRVFHEQGSHYVEGTFSEWGNTVSVRMRVPFKTTPKKAEFWSFQGYVKEYDPRTHRMLIEAEDAPQKAKAPNE